MRLTLIRRVRACFTERELDEEIATHISLQAAEYERRGMPPAEALRMALRQFGGVTQIRETYRDQSRLPFYDTLTQDLTYAWRQLQKSPVFAIAAVLTLALGIGVNTAVFRAVDTFVLRPLPVLHAGELVLLQPLDFGRPTSFNYRIYRELSDHQDVLKSQAAAGDVWPRHVTLAGGGAIKIENGRLVTGDYFSVLGAGAALGRILSRDDDQPRAASVAVISYTVWDRQFGRSPEVLGKVLLIDSVPVTVVGVAARHFLGERVILAPDLWLPMSMQPRVSGSDWLKAGGENFNFLDVLVTLRPGISLAQAQAVLDPLYQRAIAQQTGKPRDPGQDRLLLAPGSHGITLPQIQDAVLEPLRVLMWMVAAVLAIACCNLGNLLLARGAARTHEIGVRLALGASRTRLVCQLLTESLLLSGFGTILGLAIAEWGANLMSVWIADEDLELASTFDWRILIFVAAVSIAATCLFGVAPALAGTRLDIRLALQSNWRAGRQGRPPQRLGRAFVVLQVSICFLLLAGATLLARSLWNLERQDWGFRVSGLLVADLPLNLSHDFSAEGVKPFTEMRQPLFERLNVIPGVRSAAIAYGGPLGNNSWSSEVSISGRTARHSDYARVVRVSPRYFETMGIQILAGRALNESDREKSSKVAVLSQTAARRIFDGADPVGRYLSFETNFKATEAVEVVGVAHDLRVENPREDPGVVVFAPLSQQAIPFNSVVVRTDRDPAALADAVRRTLQEVTHERALGSIRPATEILEDQLAQQQTMTWLSAGLGLLALVMASVGLYGVISYAVARRTQELGIRLALGASGAQVKGLVMREVLWLVAGGMAVGGVASLAGVRVVHSLLYGISSYDTGWLLLACILLGSVAATAGYLPARRAARVDPLATLRES